MITVALSTRKKEEKILERIKQTAGVEVEILCYENNNEFSLTELYNKALNESTNDILVFVHDDVNFKSDKWGKKIYEAFHKSDYGILGKAGTTMMPETVKWWESSLDGVGQVYHQQINPNTNKPVTWLSEYSGNFRENIVDVVAVDGVLFAVHKQRIKERFDENIKGFHFYDIDFCIANYLQGVKIGVMFNFDIVHKSIGQTNDQWENNRYQVSNKYDGKLPISVEPKLIVSDRIVHIKKKPFVSIIVPIKGKVDLLKQLLESFATHINYPNSEIIIADTGSTKDEKNEIKNYIHSLIGGIEIKLIEYDYYNFGKINNDVVNNHLSSQTELLLFCNNDIVFANDCLSLMVDTYLKNKHNCGTVGARLHFEDNKVQHAGIFIHSRKVENTNVIIPGHVAYKTNYGYQNKTYTVAGNTGALLLITKVLFQKLGGFNEQYESCFEDVELNLKALLKNSRNYLCGEAVAYHLESQTRGVDDMTVGDLNLLNNFIISNPKLSSYIVKQ